MYYIRFKVVVRLLSDSFRVRKKKKNCIFNIYKHVCVQQSIVRPKKNRTQHTNHIVYYIVRVCGGDARTFFYIDFPSCTDCCTAS